MAEEADTNTQSNQGLAGATAAPFEICGITFIPLKANELGRWEAWARQQVLTNTAMMMAEFSNGTGNMGIDDEDGNEELPRMSIADRQLWMREAYQDMHRISLTNAYGHADLVTFDGMIQMLFMSAKKANPNIKKDEILSQVEDVRDAWLKVTRASGWSNRTGFEEASSHIELLDVIAVSIGSDVMEEAELLVELKNRLREFRLEESKKKETEISKTT